MPHQVDNYRFVGITSIDIRNVETKHFQNLIYESLDEFDSWIFVVRFPSEGDFIRQMKILKELASIPKVTLIATELVSISRARNAGILKAMSMQLANSNSIFLFPDDDSVVPKGNKSQISAFFTKNNSEVFVSCYGPNFDKINRVRWPISESTNLSGKEILRQVSSAGLAIRGDVFEKVGLFDEQLGVGTKCFAGEDVEIVLRAWQSGIPIHYSGLIYSIHDYKGIKPEREIGNFSVIRAYRNEVGTTLYLKSALRVFYANRSFFPTLCLGLKAVAKSFVYAKQIPIFKCGPIYIGPLKISNGQPNQIPFLIINHLSKTKLNSVSVLAAHVTSLNSQFNPKFVDSFNSVNFSYADGISFTFISFISGGAIARKIATTDLVPDLLQRLKEIRCQPVKIAIIGGESGIAEAAGNTLVESGKAELVFCTHGFWDDYGQVIETINSLDVDVVLLGLGMPKEALWVDQYRKNLNSPILVTCGGWLRLLAGTENRAPLFMQKIQLEWFWRLVTDFNRTYPRYLSGLFNIVRAIRYSLKFRR